MKGTILAKYAEVLKLKDTKAVDAGMKEINKLRLKLSPIEQAEVHQIMRKMWKENI